MAQETIEQNLRELTNALIKDARHLSWNEISDNCIYLLSEIEKDFEGTFFEERKRRLKQNRMKTPIPFEEAVKELGNIYGDLYDINLFIYHTLKSKTIIDIRYYPRKHVEHPQLNVSKVNIPMWHAKIQQPIYASKGKFDINWEHGGIRNQWNYFWWRVKNVFAQPK